MVLFSNYSRGIETARDAWCYNFSQKELSSNMQNMINFYNSEVDRFDINDGTPLKSFVNNDSTKISWSSSLLPKVEKGVRGEFSHTNISKSLYRPFSKQWLYYDNMFNHRVGQMRNIFPSGKHDNRVIYISGSGNSGKAFSALMIDTVPDLNLQHSGGQGFPLFIYRDVDGVLEKRYSIPDETVEHFNKFYDTNNISHEDIFYYIYGILHSKDYLSRYEDNLSKSLPRIPCVKGISDFWLFEKAGKNLANLHLNYESAALYPVKIEYNRKSTVSDEEQYFVEKIRFLKNGKDKDLTSVKFNNHIDIKNIPVEAYEYVVNSKPALEWVIERQQIKTDKKSQIENNPNDWAVETMSDVRYPLDIFQKVITVSVETMKIVKSLPKLDI